MTNITLPRINYAEVQAYCEKNRTSFNETCAMVRAALAAPGCERIRDFYSVGPVQRAAVESFAAALAAPQGEPPQGWKLVPVEPNEAMQYAGGAAIGGMPSNLEDADRAYRAMIAASPRFDAAKLKGGA